MNVKRAMAIQSEASIAIVSLYNHARNFGLTSAQVESKKADTFARLGVNRAPRYVRTYLAGFWQAHCDASRNDIVFGLFIGDRFYSVNRDRPDYYESNGIEPRAFSDAMNNGTRGLYWGSFNPPRPYFVSGS